jgi:O-acetyl-ADP-ribose deacetylase (regulator of RNase III)
MGGGIAALVRQKYPEAAAADSATKCGDKNKMGHFSRVTASDGKVIFNLYSQYRYGVDKRHTDYEAFFTGMLAIRGQMESLGIKTASIPHGIGCGLGGGDWTIIEAMLKSLFEKSDITLFICKYTPK